MTGKTYHDFVRDAKTRIREVTARETMQRLQDHPDTVLVDCREHNEFALGHIPGAVFIPRGVLEQNIERAVPRERTVILYCASGNRSALAADVLLQMGYRDVTSLAGGIRAWVDAGGEIAG
ncbi:MAG TPA: rhodanese-like domain-containing protein [Gemmatimonadaceae bacterium]|nr:rhodanese-like domain-containing protein [Gemmatimonadaceae bacterium]